MTSVPAVPPSSGGVPLPPWLAAKQHTTNYASMMISAPKSVRASVNKRGEIEFKTPKGVVIPPMDAINGVIMAYGRPRSYWQDAGSTEGKSPDCKSSDGVDGSGQHMVAIGQRSMIPALDGTYFENNTDAVVRIERPCASCPFAQFESGPGNSQACKQTIRLGLYIPTQYPVGYDNAGNVNQWSTEQPEMAAGLAQWWSTANNEEWPDKKAPPLIFSISPTGIKEFEAYLRWMESNHAPMEAYWTKISGSTKVTGQWTVGVPKFEGAMMSDGQEWYYNQAIGLSDHPVVADIKAPGSEDDYEIP